MQTRTISVGNVTLRYHVWGDQSLPPLLLLHGFPQDMTTWNPIAEHLSAKFMVILPEQRGYSANPPISPFSYRISILRNDLLAILEAEGIRSTHVVGHDWGGSVAWSLARTSPSRILTLTIASMPHPRALLRSLPRGQARRSWYIPLLQFPILPELLVSIFRGQIAVRMLTNSKLSHSVADRYVRSLNQLPRRSFGAFNWYRAMVFAIPELIDDQKVNAPTLLLLGSSDTVVSRVSMSYSKDYAPNSKLELIDATHWIPEEQPIRLATIISNFAEG